MIAEDEKTQMTESMKSLEELNDMPINSISDVLKKNGESGTHSIIDILEIDETDDLHQSGKISEASLLEMFSTLKPTKQQVQSKEMELESYRGRWLCTFLIVYLDDKPHEYFFTGYSGD